MKLYYPITVDLYNIYPLHKINAQQNNIGRGALITLTAAGTVIDPSDENVTLYAKKTDGTISYIPCIVSEGKIKADFTNQILALTGDVLIELLIISGSERISTPIFVISVHLSNIDEKAVESQNEFSALQEALSNMNTVLREVEDLKQNGLKGDPGAAATIKIGTVKASDPGCDPTVTNSGTQTNAVLDFTIPRGERGPTGNIDVYQKDNVLYLSRHSPGESTYSGSYTITPKVTAQTMETAGKNMADDVTINQIPIYDVSNTSGTTVVIGDDKNYGS